MINVANPIYDIVFKYLMEDERIARTILSALLQKDIVKVEVRPHEYSNTKRDTLSVFRIDFGATTASSYRYHACTERSTTAWTRC